MLKTVAQYCVYVFTTYTLPSALQPEKVEVTHGEESVLLSFKITAELPEDVTVEWTLTEPKQMKVHIYESGSNQSQNQDQFYRGRTEMNEDPLKNGDLSLILKELHLADSGVYTCTVYNSDAEFLTQKSVTLKVKGDCNRCFYESSKN